MAWEVLNEPDLGFARAKDAAAVGRKAAEFVRQVILHIRENDPARHLTTSGMLLHTAAHAEPTLALKEMDFFAAHIFSANLGSQLAADQRYLRDKFGKILLPTEAGLTPFAQDPDLTARDIHSGLWTSCMLPLPGTASPWWWVLIDRKDLYGDFAALAAFTKGEDRRGMNYRAAPADVRDLGGGRSLLARCLSSDTRAFCWVCNPIVFSQEAKWTEENPAGAAVTVPGLKDGTYTVQVWDTRRGLVMQTLEAESQDGRLTFEIPPFTQDVACKVIGR
jgi:hypothetical protein